MSDARPVDPTRCRYIAKPGGWFDGGTEVTLIADLEGFGALMAGLRGGKPDEETCPWDEFEVREPENG